METEYVMKVFPASTVADIDRHTIEHEPIASIDLMERAAACLMDWYVRHYRVDRPVLIFAGPGNNGGDALALSRMLIQRRYRVTTLLVSASGKLSQDCQINLERLESLGQPVLRIKDEVDSPEIAENAVLIDGLFGSGLNKPVKGLYAECIGRMNRSGARILSIDIPSGLFGEDNSRNREGAIVRAYTTLTFQFPFRSFFFRENGTFVGRWKAFDIGLHKRYIDELPCQYRVIQRVDVQRILPTRHMFSHKGTYGHGLVVGGSYGMMGAAILSAMGVLRTGSGLVSLYVPDKGVNAVQSAFPEAIVRSGKGQDFLEDICETDAYSAVAVGPGMGREALSMEVLYGLVTGVSRPLLIDADALFHLSANPGVLEKLPEGTILTPHPGEFDRLFGKSETTYQRHLTQLEMSAKYNIIIVLKGAYTGVAFPNGSYWFNTTGNHGMATGGSGDVLTGIILSLLSQGVAPEEAAIAGVYIHGLAGDIAARERGEEALIAGDIVDNIGNAIKQIKSKPYLHEGRRGGVIQ